MNYTSWISNFGQGIWWKV